MKSTPTLSQGASGRSRISSALACICLFLAAAPTSFSQTELNPADFQADEIINESLGILKEREPQMTAAEYAIYEKVVPMVFEQPDFALTLLEAMQDDDEPSSPAFKLVLANVYYSQDRFEDAERLYREAVVEYPSFRRAWENLGVLHFRNANYREAIPCLVRSYELGARQPRILGILGYCQLQTENPIAAETAFLNAHLADPENHRWIEALLELYLKSSQFARAEALAARRLQIKQDEPSAWLLHANCLKQIGRASDAIATLELCSTLGYMNADAFRFLADLYLAKGSTSDAARVFRLAVEEEPEHSAGDALAFALSLINQGEFEASRNILAALPDNLNESIEAKRLYAEAKLYIESDDLQQAEARINALLKLEPLNGSALLLQGSIHETRGQYAKAAFFYEQATVDTATAYQSNLRLSRLALQDSDFGSAIEHAQAALDLQSTPALTQHLARLRNYAKINDEMEF